MQELTTQTQPTGPDGDSPAKSRRPAHLQADPTVIKLCEVLRKFYWSRLRSNPGSSKRKLLGPFNELKDYVLEAWSSGLDKREECAYAGSVLLFSVLKGSGRRFAREPEEANELFLAGMRLANHLWGLLEQSGGNVDQFDMNVDEIARYLYEQAMAIGEFYEA